MEHLLHLRTPVLALLTVGFVGCDDARVMYPDGSPTLGLQGSADSGSQGGSAEVLPGPTRTGEFRIHGDRDSQQLGLGAFEVLRATPEHPAQLLVGALTDPAEGTNAGSVALHAIDWSDGTDYSDVDSLMYGSAGSTFGCGAKDIPGLGITAIGACTRSAEAGAALGAVYLFGHATLRDGGVSWEQADGRIEGALEYSGLGSSLVTGDLDGDGLTDLIAGAPGADGGRGRIYVLDDISTSTWRNTSDIAPLVRGTAGDDALGTNIHLQGDLTGDGHTDLIVCAPGWDVAGVPSAGACGVIAGGTATTDDPDLESRVVSTIYGSRIGDALGDGSLSVSVGMFLDSPGTSTGSPLSIAVGMPGAADDSGAVLVIGPEDLDGFVSATAATLRIDGDGRFGHSLASLPGGGLLVGAPEFGSGGAAFAIRPASVWMPTGEAVHASDVSDAIWIGTTPEERFGTRVAGGTDLDGDHWPDIVVGAPGPSSSSPGTVTVTALPAGWPVESL